MGDSYNWSEDPNDTLEQSLHQLQDLLRSTEVGTIGGNWKVQAVARAALLRHLSTLLAAIDKACRTGEAVTMLVKVYPPEAGPYQANLLACLSAIAGAGGVIARVRNPEAMGMGNDNIGTYEMMFGDANGQWADD